MFRIGIDVGGTFTDFVVTQDGQPPRQFKTASTPSDPSEGVLRGLQEAAAAHDLSIDDLLSQTEMLIHGTTVATNTLVERKGSRVGLITTDGFRDLLEMREGLKEDRYNLRMEPVQPLVPRYLRLGVPERVRADGSEDHPLDEAALAGALDTLADEGVDALAVCFLFSFLNPEHERRAAERIREKFPGAYVSLSHEVIPQIKEFDRLSATVINSYVGPVFGEYLLRLRERLSAFSRVSDILIMQSNGGVASIEDSSRLAVGAILSGPAGGVSGAARYGEGLGESRIIGFDMGGTSADISLIEDGAPHLTNEKFEAGWKIAVPAIDIQTLGAGGGSIARVDAGGILRVGPDSAGADPGPVCYGRGGDEPTVTDANLALGYLDAGNFLGGREPLNVDAARQALDERVAEPLGIDTMEAALGVHKVVSTTMAEGIRLMSVKRGVDPRDFAILAFGGASGLHVSAVARQLQIEKVYVPTAAPVLSALGMLSTDLQYDSSLSHPASLDDIDLDTVRSIVARLEQQGRDRLRAQGVGDEDTTIAVSADMRYLDQIYEVNVPVPDLSLPREELLREWAANFHRRYEELYSYRQSDQEIRLVTLRVSALGRLPKADLSANMPVDGPVAPKGRRRVFLGEWRDVPVYAIDGLTRDAQIEGPAILESDFTTVLVDEGDTVSLDRFGGVAMRVATGEQRERATAGASDPVTPRRRREPAWSPSPWR